MRERLDSYKMGIELKVSTKILVPVRGGTHKADWQNNKTPWPLRSLREQSGSLSFSGYPVWAIGKQGWPELGGTGRGDSPPSVHPKRVMKKHVQDMPSLLGLYEGAVSNA